jgi:hypothetical protein
MAPAGSLLRMVGMIHRLLSPTRSVSLSQCFLSTARAAPCQCSALSTVGIAMISTATPLPAILPTLLQWRVLVTTITGSYQLQALPTAHLSVGTSLFCPRL